jgi:hypothetical protein
MQGECYLIQPANQVAAKSYFHSKITRRWLIIRRSVAPLASTFLLLRILDKSTLLKEWLRLVICRTRISGRMAPGSMDETALSTTSSTGSKTSNTSFAGTWPSQYHPTTFQLEPWSVHQQLPFPEIFFINIIIPNDAAVRKASDQAAQSHRKRGNSKEQHVPLRPIPFRWRTGPKCPSAGFSLSLYVLHTRPVDNFSLIVADCGIIALVFD